MTATAPRPLYAGRHREWIASDTSAEAAVPGRAFDLLMTIGKLAHSDPAYNSRLASWRRAAFELLIDVSPNRRGRHHAPEADASVATVDGLLAARGLYLTARQGNALIDHEWDLSVIGYLGQLA